MNTMPYSCEGEEEVKRRDGWTDGQTDGRTDGRTDRPSYRDTWTYLNKFGMNNDASWMKEDEVEDEDEEDSLLTS